MRRELPGSAKYYKRLTTHRICSVQNCSEPIHINYRTATGHAFCMSHRQRYQLVELAQRLCKDGYLTCVDAVKQSALQQWINLAISGDGEIVKQRLEVHKDDLVKWHIDERML